MALQRITSIEFSTLFFGRTGNNRWDSFKKEFGVLYTGENMSSAVAETFGHELPDSYEPNDDFKFISVTELKENKVLEIMPNRNLLLAMFTEEGIPFLNLDGSILTTQDYTVTQAWTDYLHGFHPELDGIYYMTRHLPGHHGLALFERANKALTDFIDRGTCYDWQDPITGDTIKSILQRQGWTFLHN